jgi:dCTP deaminase
MILSDREILAAIARGAIGLTPCPPPGDSRWTSTAVDLTLDAEIRPWEGIRSAGQDVLIDPARPGFNSNALIDQHTRPQDCTRGFVIFPGKFVLGWTVEKLKLPHTAKIAARQDRGPGRGQE